MLFPLIARVAPFITLRVERADVQLVQRLENGTADLAFVPLFLAAPSLLSLRLPDESFVTLMREGHPARGRKLSLQRYLGARPRGGRAARHARQPRRSGPRGLGQRRRVRLWVQHFAAIPFILARSDLVVTCPASAARFAGPGIRAVSPPLDLGLDQTAIVWHPRVDADTGHRWLHQLTICAAREHVAREKASR